MTFSCQANQLNVLKACSTHFLGGMMVAYLDIAACWYVFIDRFFPLSLYTLSCLTYIQRLDVWWFDLFVLFVASLEATNAGPEVRKRDGAKAQASGKGLQHSWTCPAALCFCQVLWSRKFLEFWAGIGTLTSPKIGTAHLWNSSQVLKYCMPTKGGTRAANRKDDTKAAVAESQPSQASQALHQLFVGCLNSETKI